MHFVYGFCTGNAAEAEREYRTRFPQRRHLRRRVFEASHRRMGETGTVCYNLAIMLVVQAII